MDTLQTGGYSASAGDAVIAGNSAIESLMPPDYAALRRTMVERQVRTFEFGSLEIRARQHGADERCIP